MRYEQVNLFATLKFDDAQDDRAARRSRRSSAASVDSVYLVYNEFKSVMQQRVVVERLLPIPRLEIDGTGAGGGAADRLSVRAGAGGALRARCIPRHVEMQIYRALLESSAAEHAARMTAMDAATRNSAEMIEQLTLYMNKVRQAAITREIIEVVSGAQAL